MSMSTVNTSSHLDAVARLRRAIVASVFLSEEKRKAFLERLDVLSAEYVRQAEESFHAQQKEIALCVARAGERPPSPVVEFFAQTPNFVSSVSAFVDALTAEVAHTGQVEFLTEVSVAFRESFLRTRPDGALKMTVAQACETLLPKGTFDPATVSSLEEALPGLRTLGADEDLDEDEREDLAELIAAGRVQIQEQVDAILRQYP